MNLHAYNAARALNARLNQGVNERPVEIDLCHNDPDTGLETDRVLALHLPAGALELECRSERGLKISFDSRGFRLGGKHCRAYGSTYGVGNWCWNAYSVPVGDAVQLLAHLRTRKLMTRDTGWTELFDWWNGERELPEVRLQRLLLDAQAARRL